MIPDSLSPIANHLWQSTLFAGIAGLLTLALRKNSARVRHWIWVAASVKFLIPFSVLITIGDHIEWRRAAAIAPNVSIVVEQVSQPFTAVAASSPMLDTVQNAPNPLPEVVFGIWACGFVGVAFSWWIRWRRIRIAVRGGSPIQLGLPIQAIASPSFLEPGVFGVFRPILLVPEGIFEHLTPDQWRTVVAHELCHVRHRDNLIGIVQMSVETAFWFHPLVWWIGKRVFQEREIACDEEVLRLGIEPRTYAHGILKVCELYLESPVACVAGVSGSNLRKRIEGIMENRNIDRMNTAKRIVLAFSGFAAIAIPVLIGILGGAVETAAQLGVPQSETREPKFEVAAIKRSRGDAPPRVTAPGPARFAATSITVRGLIAAAFGTMGRTLTNDQISSGPKWIDSERFDIIAKSGSVMTPAESLLMLQTLLEERFGLVFHYQTDEGPVYALLRASSGGALGPQLRRSSMTVAECETAMRAHAAGGELPEGGPPCRLRVSSDREAPPDQASRMVMIGRSVTMAQVVDRLSGFPALGREVIDRTGLEGRFDLDVRWIPPARPRSDDAADSLPVDVGPSLFEALERQLGLKLSGTRGPIRTLVIDRVMQPTLD